MRQWSEYLLTWDLLSLNKMAYSNYINFRIHNLFITVSALIKYFFFLKHALTLNSNLFNCVHSFLIRKRSELLPLPVGGLLFYNFDLLIFLLHYNVTLLPIIPHLNIEVDDILFSQKYLITISQILLESYVWKNLVCTVFYFGQLSINNKILIIFTAQ